MSVQEDSPLTTDRKTLYVIRHGTSTANEWMSRPGNIWGDATFQDNLELVDARLSDEGRRQAEHLAKKLAAVEWLAEVELVVVSPLTRCLETFELGVKPALLQTLEESTRSTKVPDVVVNPLFRERVYTSSDTGRPRSVLEAEFGQLDWSAVPDGVWWHSGTEDGEYEEWRPAGEGQWYAVDGEPRPVFEARMTEADEWINERPEKCILIISHWGVIRHWTGEEVENCGIGRIDWSKGVKR